MSGSNWKSQHHNVCRADGEWVNVSVCTSRFRGGVRADNKHLQLPLRPTPALAAADVDRVLYKLHRPDADTNGTLTPEVKAQLDGLSLDEVVAQIKATGGQAFSGGKSAYRGVFWDKRNQKWTGQMKIGNGQKLCKRLDSELEAARQYDAWCKQYGRPLSNYNFQPSNIEQEAPGVAAVPAISLAGAAAAATASPAAAAAAPPASPVAAPPASTPAAPPASSAAAPTVTPAKTAVPPQPQPAAAAAAAAAPVAGPDMAAGRHAPATTAVGPSTSPSSSTWQHWLDGDGGGVVD